MVIFTAKVTKKKLLLALSGVVAIVAIVAVLAGRDPSAEATAVTTENSAVEFITSLGWEVDPVPLETQEVLIPKESSPIFEGYNQIQKNQGYDLEKYSGKRVEKVTYRVLNHPSGEEDVRLSVLTYKDKIIGGDVSSGKSGGFIHGLEKTGEEGTVETPEPEESSEPK